MSVRLTLLCVRRASIHRWSVYLEGVVGAAVVEVVAEAGDEERQRLQLRDHAATQQVEALDQLASDASVMEKIWGNRDARAFQFHRCHSLNDIGCLQH